MISKNEINKGYIKFIQSTSTSADQFQRKKKFIIQLLQFFYNILQILLVLVLFLYCIILTVTLRFILLFSGSRKSSLHQDALPYIERFIEQYPLHLYPILAKSLELAFMRRHINLMTEKKDCLVELAVGEGSFSQQIFGEQDCKLTVFDINPYSLVHTNSYTHITRRIVADCLNPPIAEKSAAFLISLNLLHHVTEKENTLKNWSKISEWAIFNENTIYWGNSWFWPRVASILGLQRLADNIAKSIKDRSLQYLLPEKKLEALVRKYYSIKDRESFIHQNSFFLCAVTSFLLRCYGPPTPKFTKKILNKYVPNITRIVCYQAAKAIIDYDATLKRNKDVFIFWLGRSLSTEVKLCKTVALVCPDCQGLLTGNKCSVCLREYWETSNMLFLLPKELMAEIKFKEFAAAILGRQHL